MKEEYTLKANQYSEDGCPECGEVTDIIDMNCSFDGHGTTRECPECHAVIYENWKLDSVSVEPFGSEYNKGDD